MRVKWLLSVIAVILLGLGGYFFFREPELKIPLGLPPIPWPKDNPYSKEKVELGRLLYFDKRLSSNHTVSCASCHNVPCGYSDCRAIAVGIDGREGTRRSQSIINSAYDRFLFWDGRAKSLEEQCQGPLGNTNEMTTIANPHEAHTACADQVNSILGYKALFKKAFGDEDITIDRVSQAIATFERTILSGNAPYDRYMSGDRTAMTEEQVHGMHVFQKVSCSICHSGFNFTNGDFQNIGIGMDAPNPDLGRYRFQPIGNYWGAFKAPSLREAEHKAPYMHDGSLKTLEDVVDYYDRGGIKNKGLHPLIRPLHLSDGDKKALVSFMKALSGEGWQHVTEPSLQEYPQ